MKKLLYFVVLLVAFLFCSCEPNIDKPKETIDINFDVEWYKVRINVDGKDIPTSAPYKTYKNEPLVFSILGDVSFKLVKVEYKYTDTTTETGTDSEEPSYQELTPINGKYTIDKVDKNITLKITVTLNKTTITFGFKGEAETDLIKYRTLDDKDIDTAKSIDIVLGDSYSFKIVDSRNSRNYSPRMMLTYGDITEELLNENGIYTINGEMIIGGATTGVSAVSEYMELATFRVENTEKKDIFQICHIVGKQNVIAPLTWEGEEGQYGGYRGKINKNSEYSFKVKLNDPTQYEIQKVSLSYANKDGWQDDGDKYLFGPTEDGVYTLKIGNDWDTVSLKIELNSLWYPLTLDGDVTVTNVKTDEILTNKIFTGESVRFALTPNDPSVVVTSVELEYRMYDSSVRKNVWIRKEISGVKNANGVFVYTIPYELIIDNVGLYVNLASQKINLITLGDSVKWTLENGDAIPKMINRFSYLNFKVEPTTKGEIIDTVNVTYGENTTTIVADENGVYVLTKDMTSDNVSITATTKLPSVESVALNFKGEYQTNTVITVKEYPSLTVIPAIGNSATKTITKEIQKQSEFKFTVEIEDWSKEEFRIDKVYALFNGTRTELKKDNGIYTLSPYITSYDVNIIAEIREAEINLTLDSNPVLVYSDENGEVLPKDNPIPLQYKTDYRFKVVCSDSSKKISRIRVLTRGGSNKTYFLYKSEDDFYTLPASDIIERLILTVDIVNADGDEITVIEKDQTVNVENKDGKIPYVLITNFTPSKTYASEPLKTDLNEYTTVRSNNVYNYSLSPNSVSPQTYSRKIALFSDSSESTPVQKLSAPHMENGKVVWNDFAYELDDNQIYKINYKEVYTDKDNKIIYMLDSDKYSVGDDAPVRTVINYMYNKSDILKQGAVIQPDLLLTLQKNVATPSEIFPNKAYLFDKSETDRGYFFVMMDKFQNRGWSASTGGYFSPDIFSGRSLNAPYGIFYLNTCSSFTGKNDFAETVTRNASGIAKNFINIFSHEYTHYLEKDYKFTKEYENTNSLLFLTEGYANYNAGKATKDATFGNRLEIYLSEMLANHKIYDPKDADHTSYGLGHLFFLYLEEKYGEDMPGRIMTDDKPVFKAVEDQIGKTFGEIYNDFILDLVFSGFTDTVNINGKKYGNTSFANYTSADYGEHNGFVNTFTDASTNIKNKKETGNAIIDSETKEDIYEDVKMILGADEGITSVLGEMSFRLVCYPNGAPSTLTLTSDSPFIKAYLFYSDKIPQENL